MTIGDAIRAARKARGLTQNELAHAMGITGAAIGQYECGIRNPKYETVERISSALSVPTSSLMPGVASEIKRLTDRCARYAEEIADVGIMLDQMAIEFQAEDAVAEQRAHKVRRLRSRLEYVEQEV